MGLVQRLLHFSCASVGFREKQFGFSVPEQRGVLHAALLPAKAPPVPLCLLVVLS